MGVVLLKVLHGSFHNICCNNGCVDVQRGTGARRSGREEGEESSTGGVQDPEAG